MTYKELLESEKEFLAPADVAPIIGCSAYTLTLAARQCPEKLGFPTLCLKSRVRIPRRAFIRYCEGDGGQQN